MFNLVTTAGRFGRSWGHLSGVVFLSLCLAGAGLCQGTAVKQEDPPDLAELKARNALLEEQLKLITNQTNLAKTLIPQFAGSLEGTFERKGDLSVEMTEFAYRALEDATSKFITRWKATLIKGDSGYAPTPVDLSTRCLEKLKEKERTACIAGVTGANNDAPLNKPVFSRVLLHGERQVPNLLEWIAFKHRLKEVQARLDGVLSGADQEPPTRMAPAAALGLVGPALQSITELLKLFRKNVVITTATIDADETALTSLLGNLLRSQGFTNEVWHVAAMPPSLLTESPTVLPAVTAIRGRLQTVEKRLAELDVTRQAQTAAKSKLDKLIAGLGEDVNALESAITRNTDWLHAESDPKRKEVLQKTVERLTTDRDATAKKLAETKKEVEPAKGNLKKTEEKEQEWKDLLAVGQEFLTALAQRTAGGAASQLSEWLRIEKIAALWHKAGTGILQTRIHRTAANSRVVKSTFTGQKEDTTGGTVISFLVYDGNTGLLRYSWNEYGAGGPAPKPKN